MKVEAQDSLVEAGENTTALPVLNSTGGSQVSDFLSCTCIAYKRGHNAVDSHNKSLTHNCCPLRFRKANRSRHQSPLLPPHYLMRYQWPRLPQHLWPSQPQRSKPQNSEQPVDRSSRLPAHTQTADIQRRQREIH